MCGKRSLAGLNPLKSAINSLKLACARRKQTLKVKSEYVRSPAFNKMPQGSES